MRTNSQNIAELKRQVRKLQEFQQKQREAEHLMSIAQNVANRLFELGASKVDMKLIAKLNAALGCDVMPIKK